MLKKLFHPRGGGGCKPIALRLTACALAATLCLITPALADETYTPTLDKLHESGITMPESTEIYPESAYTLTPVENPDPANLPQNTITLYEKQEITKYFDPETGKEVTKDALLPDIEYKEVKTTEITPKYYTVSLKQTEYGYGDSAKYFKWEKTEEGIKLTETTAENAQITAKYDTSKIQERITNSSDKSSINIEGGSFVGKPGGSAITNDGDSAKLGDITADFIGNYSSSFHANGGAIDNYEGTIGDITGDFIGNYVSSYKVSSYDKTTTSQGGAIYTYKGTIGDIKGDFIGNYASVSGSSSSYFYRSYGGAIFNNESTIGDITGDFIGNYVSGSGFGSDSESASFGGAICNMYIIGDITGDFIGNYTSSDSDSLGGAIFSSHMGFVEHIELKNSSFINNYAESKTNTAYGGAIFSVGNINITADNGQSIFSGNKTISNGVTEQNAIDIYGIYVSAEEAEILGLPSSPGFVSSTGTLLDKNTVSLTLKAINNGTITINDTIRGGAVGYFDLLPNQIINESPESAYTLHISGDQSGTIYLNNAVINANITLEKTNLYLGADTVFDQSKSLTLTSGSLSMANKSTGTLNNVILNSTSTIKLAIDANLNTETTDTLNISSAITGSNIQINQINALNEMQESKTSFTTAFLTGNDLNNITTTLAPELTTIYSQSSMYNVQIDGANLAFSRSEKTGGLPGAVADNGDRTFIMSSDEIVNNWNTTTQNNMQGSTLVVQGNNNSVLGQQNEGILLNNSQSLSINNTKSWENFSSTNGGAINNNNSTTTITDSSFKNNSASQSGGAIYNESGVVNVIANTSTVTFENNTANNASNAIHNVNATLNLNASSGNDIIFNDSITSDASSTININATKDSVATAPDSAPADGTIVINNDMSGYKGDVNLYHGTLKLGADGKFFDAQNFTVYGCTLDLANGIAQATSFNTLNIPSNTLDMIIDADLSAETIDTITAQNTITTPDKIHVSQINLLSDATKEQLTLNFTDDSLKSAVKYTGKDTAYSNIYKYAVKYDENTGDFTFSRYAANSTNGFNPAIIPGAVAQQGAFLTMLDIYDQAFANMDMYSIEQNSKNHAQKFKNKTAARSGMPYEEQHSLAWFRPYASFENVPLKNGPRVSNVQYGSLFGVDSDITTVKYGFERLFSAYTGYVGSHQAFQGQSIYQNGGVLGASVILYKNNFFTGLTINTAGIQAEATTTNGRDDMTMLTAGIAAKTGYNLQMFKDRLIVQPNAMMSYTFVNTFDYHTKNGVNMDSSPLNALQILPGIKIIGNFKNGWQPYLRVAMVFNIMDDTKFKANDVSLPELSVKPYVLYGAGVQKQHGDRFTCYLQTLLRSGGRNGIGFSAGLKWKI